MQSPEGLEDSPFTCVTLREYYFTKFDCKWIDFQAPLSNIGAKGYGDSYGKIIRIFLPPLKTL